MFVQWGGEIPLEMSGKPRGVTALQSWQRGICIHPCAGHQWEDDWRGGEAANKALLKVSRTERSRRHGVYREVFPICSSRLRCRLTASVKPRGHQFRLHIPETPARRWVRTFPPSIDSSQSQRCPRKQSAASKDRRWSSTAGRGGWTWRLVVTLANLRGEASKQTRIPQPENDTFETESLADTPHLML